MIGAMLRATRAMGAMFVAWTMVTAAPTVAAPVFYDLTLTQSTGNVVANGAVAGSGAFSIDGDDLPFGAFDTFSPSNAAKTLLTLTFSIDGRNFSLANGPGSVTFLGTSLFNITYAGQFFDGIFSISISVNGLQYQYFDQGTSHSSIGTITSALRTAPPTSTVTEPMSLMLLGGGLAALGLLRRRRTAAPA